MLAGARRVDRRGLMGEEAFDALGVQAGVQLRGQRRGQRAKARRSARDRLQVDDLILVERLAAELSKKPVDVHELMSGAGYRRK